MSISRKVKIISDSDVDLAREYHRDFLVERRIERFGKWEAVYRARRDLYLQTARDLRGTLSGAQSLSETRRTDRLLAKYAAEKSAGVPA